MSSIKKKLKNLYYTQRNLKYKNYKKIKTNFRTLSGEKTAQLRNILIDEYFHSTDKAFFETGAGQQTLHSHLIGRINSFRNEIIPWLDNIHPLHDSKILEIGCGTGTSTVSLAEQGANVYAIDITTDYLIARKRCEFYGLDARIEQMNATEIQEKIDEKFDLIIFFASLEHMTYQERITSIRQSYELLKPHGFLVVLETPNRLWIEDVHTSLTNFYNWLPNDLAIDYAKYTNRPDFKNKFLATEHSEADIEKFIRWGRGASYHEFEIALGSQDKIKVAGYLSRISSVSAWKFKRILKKYGPVNMNDGFYEPILFIALEKV